MERSKNNYHLIALPKYTYKKEINRMVAEAGCRTRKDSVMMVETLKMCIRDRAEIKEPTVIYMERPLRKAEYTIHIEVPPNPFWASVGSVSYTHLDVYKRQTQG